MIIPQLEIINIIDSTNSELKRRLQNCQGAETLPSGLSLMARQQVQGRGRMQRAWQSFSGNLTASFFVASHAETPAAHSAEDFGELTSSVGPAVKESLPRPLLGPLPLVSGLAVLDALALMAAQAGLPKFPFGCKWPNDVWLEGSKMAGILCEYVAPRPHSRAEGVVVGIGLNLAATAGELAKLDKKATSWYALTGQKPAVEDVYAQVAHCLFKRVERLAQEGFAAMSQEWNENCCHIGQTVGIFRQGRSSVTLAGEALSGQLPQEPAADFWGKTLGVNEQGHLLLECKGQIQAVTMGDVEML